MSNNRTVDHMMANEVLLPGQTKSSANGRLRLVFGTDGSLKLFDAGRGMLLLWAAPASATGSLVMQHDGNLVLYTPGRRVAWATGTWGNLGAYLVLQNDGNMVIYRQGKALWASGTYQFQPSWALQLQANMAAALPVPATMHGDIVVDRKGRVYHRSPRVGNVGFGVDYKYTRPGWTPYDSHTYKQDIGFGADIDVDRHGRVYHAPPHGPHALPYDSRTYRQDLGFGRDHGGGGGRRRHEHVHREYDREECMPDEDVLDELGDGEGT
jgi:hypothetical protein